MKTKTRSALQYLPPSHSLNSLREAARTCEGCSLYRYAKQTVFGEGSSNAEILLVGEQPGDREDIEGRPFVGPAGRLLDRCLQEAGIDREKSYTTNIVKHFKWQQRGKRRIHEKPNSLEIIACRPWFDAEVDNITPKLIVCLGATAAQALLGRSFRVTQHRGEIFREAANHLAVMATVHPSSLLRNPDDEERHREIEKFVADLKLATAFVMTDGK